MTSLSRVFLAVFLTTACASMVAPQSAFAQDSDAERKKRALRLYEKGTTQYNLGNYPQAIRFFTDAYTTLPAPAFLFNIGQAHRQNKNCDRALFFYRRYLAVKPDASNRDEVEGFIQDQEKQCAVAEKNRNKPPVGAIPPDDRGRVEPVKPPPPPPPKKDPPKKVVTTPPAKKDAQKIDPLKKDPPKRVVKTPTPAPTPAPTATATAAEQQISSDTQSDVAATMSNMSEDDQGDAALLTVQLLGGPTVLGIGALNAPAQMSYALSVGYPLEVAGINLEIGGLFSQTALPWSNPGSGTSGTAGLSSLLANLGANLPIMDNIDARADFGVGMMFMSGLEGTSNVFVEPGMAASGTLSMFHTRVALGATYALSDMISLMAQPLVFTYSPSKTGMREDISKITSYQFLVGASVNL